MLPRLWESLFQNDIICHLTKNIKEICGYVGAEVRACKNAICACVLSHFSHVSLWHHGPQSTRLLCPRDFEARILTGVGLPFPPPGDPSHPWIEPASPVAPALVGVFSNTEPPALSKNGHSSIHWLLTIHYVLYWVLIIMFIMLPFAWKIFLTSQN